jgi:hypothetical protein
MNLPLFKIDRGRLDVCGDPPFIVVSVIAHPFYFYLTGALAFVAAMAVLTK